MAQGDFEGVLKEAASIVSEAERMAEKVEKATGPLEYEAVVELVDPVIDRIEEANHLLIELEVEGLPDVLPTEEGELPEADEEGEGFKIQVRKQEIEDRARRLEARVYRKAADLAGPALTVPGQGNEGQNEMLANAGTALEAAFASRPAPETALGIADVRILQGEPGRARQAAEVALKLDPEGPAGARAKEVLARLDTDPALKEKSRCFIASAACGVGSPEVETLRRFRDNVLEKSAPGRAFVRSYYRVSPPIALLIESHPRLRRVVRSAFVKPLSLAVSAVLKIKR